MAGYSLLEGRDLSQAAGSACGFFIVASAAGRRLPERRTPVASAIMEQSEVEKEGKDHGHEDVRRLRGKAGRRRVRRRIPGEGQTVQYLCELHAAEARGGRPPLGASSLGGGSLFDDFFDRFFDEGRTALPGGGTALRRRAEQMDVTQFFSAATTELLQRAARQAHEWGSLDLTGEHLLYAALEDTVVRRVLEGAGADPDALRAQLEEEAQKGGRTDVSPTLAPDAKRALLAASDESSRDLTEAAREGKLDPVIGRADEVETTIEILSRRTKNNPVLIGDPGVGKTAIVEGIAQPPASR
jgi:hypothetical protein